MSGGRRYRWYITGLLLLAAVLRFHALFANAFHPDEALFATFARLIATWRDPLLQTQLVDKPPLLFYLQALFYPLLGPVAWAARLPNFIASLLLIPLTGRLVLHLYRDPLAALLAAALITLSPLTIQFSATAFTDPLLVTLLMASLVAATRPTLFRIPYSAPSTHHPSPITHHPSPITHHPSPITFHASRITFHALPGLLFGLAAATKYQASLFLPLLLALHTFRPSPQSKIQNPKSKTPLQSPISNLLLAIIPALLAVFLWELARTGRFTLWHSQLAGYGGLRLAWSWELWPRLNEWGKLWGYLLGSPVLAFGLLLAMPPFLALLIHDQDRPTTLDQFFLLYLLTYVLLHWFVAVPVWDRYLLPAVPIAALLLGRFASRLFAFATPLLGDLASRPTVAAFLPLAITTALILAQLPPAFQARLGHFPIGGRPAADNGAAEVAALLAHAPYGTVLYDHWYSWQWRYHLLDSGVYVSWFPHPAALARDLTTFGRNHQPRYLALPDTPAAQPILQVINVAGFQANHIHTAAGGITLYQITSP
jgi:4-amino-4-deoxy-L-arabinose transferase-like glycosyltransferase